MSERDQINVIVANLQESKPGFARALIKIYDSLIIDAAKLDSKVFPGDKIIPVIDKPRMQKGKEYEAYKVKYEKGCDDEVWFYNEHNKICVLYSGEYCKAKNI